MNEAVLLFTFLLTWHSAGSLRVNLVFSTKYEYVEFTRPLDVWPSQVGDQISAGSFFCPHIMNFRSKQLDPMFTPNGEITEPADHSVIKIIKIKSWSPENEQTRGWIMKWCFFIRKKRTDNNHEIIVILMFHSLWIWAECFEILSLSCGGQSKSFKLVAERKNFKLLFSEEITLAFEVSILYFCPMRMI